MEEAEIKNRSLTIEQQNKNASDFWSMVNI